MSNCRSANEIVTLSDDMAKTISDRDQKEILNINIIKDGYPDDSREGNLNIMEELQSNQKFRIVYTGNIGRFQKLETIIDAFRIIPEERPIELVIVGKGLQESFLKRRSGDRLGKSIKFIDFQNPRTLNAIIESADLGLVSLLNGVERCAFPSKMFNYLNQGCPVLALMDECFLTRFIEDNDIGFSYRHEDLDFLSSKLIEISSIKDIRSLKKIQINNVMKVNTNQAIVTKWSELLNKL